jgi:hypothetical protein
MPAKKAFMAGFYSYGVVGYDEVSGERKFLFSD